MDKYIQITLKTGVIVVENEDSPETRQTIRNWLNKVIFGKKINWNPAYEDIKYPDLYTFIKLIDCTCEHNNIDFEAKYIGDRKLRWLRKYKKAKLRLRDLKV